VNVPRRPLLADLARALAAWEKSDPILARLARAHGPRSMPRARDGAFSSLVTSLIHQQVSVAAGRTITLRVKAACGGRITPHAIARLLPRTLRAAGLSRQKQSYVLDLAQRTLSGELNFRRISRMSDQAAIEALTQVRGVGTWTARMFLLFHMERPDVVAPEDLGLRMAVSRAYRVPEKKAAEFLIERSAVWRPYGSLASLVLWAHKDA
jgi:DNA-3-methyladenine glycosylase II